MAALIEIVTGKPGYCPQGDGKARGFTVSYGQNAEGTSYTKDGNLRKKREKLTNLERMRRDEEARDGRLKTYAREVFAKVAVITVMLKNAAILRAWDAMAASLDTQEKVNAKAAKQQAYIDSLQARHDAALEYQENRTDTSALGTFEANVGKDVESFLRENGVEPTEAEAEALCLAHLSPELQAALAAAADPANDPFGPWRKGATEDDDDSDTL